MQIIDRNSATSLPENNTAALFFIETWYTMVHRKTLDSHRVRSMDSLSILKELQDLLLKHGTEGFEVTKDIPRCAAEAVEILSHDSVVQSAFASLYGPIIPHLEKISVPKEGKEFSIPPMMRYLLKDFLQAMEASYRNEVVQRLKASFDTPADFASVYQLTGLYLARLLDEGYILADLFSIVENIFVRNRSKPPKTFTENLDFAILTLERPARNFEVIFRLEGIDSDKVPASIIAGVSFDTVVSAIPPFKKPVTDAPTLARSGLEVCFARMTVVARNHRSAGLQGRTRLASVLDLLRFEMIQEAITVDDRFISFEENVPQTFIHPIPDHIPNPQHHVRAADFQQFVELITGLYDRSGAETEMTNKLQAAFRLYRMGRDTSQPSNKFINWWTAMENITKSGHKGGIIEGVEKRLLPCLVMLYVVKFLDDYRSTFRYLAIETSPTAVQTYAAQYVYDLNNLQMLAYLRDDAEFADLEAKLSAYPAFLQQLRYFRSRTKTPQDVKRFLETHKKRLTWHLHRLYRVRCDIVHNADSSRNLTLLSANLEFYLKSVLLLVLSQLKVTPTIQTLPELFERLDDTNARFMTDLEKGKKEIFAEILRGQLT